jgi:hypothetical protein
MMKLFSKRKRNTLAATALISLATAFAIAGSCADEPSLRLTDPAAFQVTNGSLESQDGVLRWHVANGSNSVLDLKPPLVDQLHGYDLLQFDLRVVSGGISTVEVNTLGNLGGDRRNKVANWTVAVSTMPHEEWRPHTLVLARPAWFPWDDPAGSAVDHYFHFECLGVEPNTVVEIRNLRFTRALLYLKPDYEAPFTWPMKKVNDDGSVSYTIGYRVLNMSNRPDTIAARVLSTNPRFKVAFDKTELPAKNGETVAFNLTATISASDIAATKELYREPLDVEFAPASAPQAGWAWHGDLVRPLSSGFHRQVLVGADDLKILRDKVVGGDKDARNMTNLNQLQPMADTLLGVRFAELPRGRGTIHNSLPSGWAPGAFMPEIVNTKTGAREVDTPLADLFWKEYMAYHGGAESLAQAYLLSGDEKYAAKAVELFQLFGDQYQELNWYSQFNGAWNQGDMTLSSSRMTGNVTYGTNWMLKWHMRLLSAISESQSWQALGADQKQKIYTGFALPLATELMKFPATVSNQNDISNGDLFLLGLTFDDANMVYRALYSDAGLLRRIADITPDGFSAEGRPLNYHFAGMTEYLPTLVYLANSGLKIDYPAGNLLAAIKMPYQRAALTGLVPASGDCGRGASWYAGRQPLADYLYALFPQEQWLYDIGTLSTPAAQAHFFATGKKPDEAAWRQLLETTPQLFPDGGMAVLRSGDTPETQIQLTLDYGRNVFHGALDRNQIDLQAFGLVFTHGVGSLYNAGSGGIALNPDKKLQSFITHGSLGANVVLVDGQDQQPAIGKLLAWNPGPQRQFAVTRVDGIAPGVSHTRGVVLEKGVIVLLDRVQSNDAHTYDWAFHDFGALQVQPPYAASTPTAKLDGAANYDNILDLQQLSGNGVLGLRWDLSNEIPAPELWPKDRQKQPIAPPPTTASLNFWQLPPQGDALQGELFTGATGMNDPNTKRVPDRAPSVFRRVRGKSFDLVTVLEPRAAGGSNIKSVTPQGDGVLITFTDGTSITENLDALLRQRDGKISVAQGRF